MRAWQALVLGVLVVGSCKSDPIDSEEPSGVVSRCCAEARERVETVKDRESDQFRKWCSACRRGDSKGGCASAAKNVLHAVKGAYGDFGTPSSCSAMMGQLQELGIEQ